MTGCAATAAAVAEPFVSLNPALASSLTSLLGSISISGTGVPVPAGAAPAMAPAPHPPATSAGGSTGGDLLALLRGVLATANTSRTPAYVAPVPALAPFPEELAPSPPLPSRTDEKIYWYTWLFVAIVIVLVITVVSIAFMRLPRTRRE